MEKIPSITPERDGKWLEIFLKNYYNTQSLLIPAFVEALSRSPTRYNPLLFFSMANFFCRKQNKIF